jgi:hypothetical protein
MPTYSLNLTEEAAEYLRFTMDKEKVNRSRATSYLIRMGYLYRYKVLEKEISEKKELKRKEESK